MKLAIKLTLFLALSACCLPLSSGVAQQPTPTAVGYWEKVEDGKPSGWFRVYEKDGLYEAQIVKVFPKPGEDPSGWRCTKCEDERKDAPVLGITLIKAMKQVKPGVYEGGNILDPRDGSIYNAKMDVTPDGQTLSMRGFLGISLFGRTETWRKLDDKVAEAEYGKPNTALPQTAQKPPARGSRGPATAANPNPSTSGSKPAAPPTTSGLKPPVNAQRQ
jgi:hypothetical protein